MHKFSTPYVHTPIGTVERNLRTLENHIKTYLIEDNNFRKAVNRATRVLRFTISKSTGATPFEIHFGRKPRNIFSNLIDLENDGKGIIENVYDLQGNHLAQNQYEADQLRRHVFNRTHGKSASEEDLTKEIQKRKVRPQIQFFVPKNRKHTSLSSKFEIRLRAATAETDHTVSDGKTTFHKKDIADVTQITQICRARSASARNSRRSREINKAVSPRRRTPHASTKHRSPPKRRPRPPNQRTPAKGRRKLKKQPRRCYLIQSWKSSSINRGPIRKTTNRWPNESEKETLPTSLLRQPNRTPKNKAQARNGPIQAWC